MTATADNATQQERQEFYGRIGPQGFAPLWEVLHTIVTPAPRPTPQPHLWPWSTVRPLLMEASGLITADEAERRVLVLENPAFPGKTKATATLFAGVQMVMPGEIARAHRHTQSALRFVLESKGGYTAVGGERTTMRPGDFVITPSWSFHDHGNEGDEPVLWLDVLDLPMVAFFEGSFAQPLNDQQQMLTRPEGDALARYGAGLLPITGGSPFGANSPIFSYPYDRTRETLLTVAKGSAPDTHLGVTLKYSNPLDGGWAMPTIASWMTHLPKGFATAPMRSTDGLIVAVAEGHGAVTVGDQRLEFGPRDVFVVPNWTWRHFEASSDCFLFCSSDRAAQEKLGLWREEAKAANAA